MANYTNFYESIKEARMRIHHTVVLYDGLPYYVLAVDDHMADGIFRVYLDDINQPQGCLHTRVPIPYEPQTPGASVGQQLDQWITENPDKPLIRKMMNSPKFNKFRPFPLGNHNSGRGCLYLERSPSRYTQQGLTSSMVTAIHVALESSRDTAASFGNNILTQRFAKTVLGEYPSPEEAVEILSKPGQSVPAVGFSRTFAFVRGPLSVLYLAYKGELIGFIPGGDLKQVHLSKQKKYLAEVVDELRLFSSIQIKE